MQKINKYRSDTKFVALSITSSVVFIITGTFLQPGDFNILNRSFKFSCRTFGGHISIFVITTKTGTANAKAKPKCSLVIPTIPALAPIYKLFCENIHTIIYFIYHQHSKIRCMTSHSKYRCLQVSLMSSKINKCDYF